MTAPSQPWLEPVLDANTPDPAARLAAAFDEIAWALGAGHPAVDELAALLGLKTPARQVRRASAGPEGPGEPVVSVDSGGPAAGGVSLAPGGVPAASTEGLPWPQTPPPPPPHPQPKGVPLGVGPQYDALPGDPGRVLSERLGIPPANGNHLAQLLGLAEPAVKAAAELPQNS